MGSYNIGDGDDLLGAVALLGGDDDLGASLLMGDDIMGDDDIVGAVRKMTPGQAKTFAVQAARRARAQQQRLQALANTRAAGGIAVSQHEPTRGRVQILGFDSVTAIVALASAQVAKQPQILFRARRLVVADAIASQFLIDDLRVGKNSQFVAAGSVPASAFKPDAVAEDLKLDTCQTAASITLTVTNFMGADARFVAMMIGDSAE